MLQLSEVPDMDIVKKHHSKPAKVTYSDIEKRLQCLKYDDAERFMMKNQVKVKHSDGFVQFKITREALVKIQSMQMKQLKRNS